MQPTELPLKSVVLFIATGALLFILVFIFVKRQITRFALKSSRGPHVPIGTSAPKALREEIERRLRRVDDIKFEPTLIEGREPDTPPKYFDGNVYHYHYRMKALDKVKLLDAEFEKYNPATVRRARTSLRLYLMEQQQGGALKGMNAATIERFFYLYEHARHEPMEFRETEYEEYNDLFNQLIQHIRNKINKGDNKKTFPFHIGDSVFYCPQATDSVPLIGKPKPHLTFRNTKYGGVEAASKAGTLQTAEASY